MISMGQSLRLAGYISHSCGLVLFLGGNEQGGEKASVAEKEPAESESESASVAVVAPATSQAQGEVVVPAPSQAQGDRDQQEQNNRCLIFKNGP